MVQKSMKKSVKRVMKKSPKKSRAPRSTIKGKCPYGYIERKGYSAVRKNTGKKYSVKKSCILEKGRPGPGRKGTIKRRVIKISHPGSLTSFGYALSKSTSDRHLSLKKVLREFGYASSIRKLNALATLFKNTNPEYYEKLQKDMDYIRKIGK